MKTFKQQKFFIDIIINAQLIFYYKQKIKDKKSNQLNDKFGA